VGDDMKKAIIMLVMMMSTLISFADVNKPEGSGGATWIKALISQYPPPAKNITDYVKAMYQLAPNLEQYHIRVMSQDIDVHPIAELMVALKATYPNMKIAYHPNLWKNKSAATAWGCSTAMDPATKDCMIAAVINKLNDIESAVNKLIAKESAAKIQFDIFSLEQSYIVDGFGPDDNTRYNACFNKNVQSSACPPDVVKQLNPLLIPSLQIGNVKQVGGNADAFGVNKLQWGYQQLYNAYKSNVKPSTFTEYLDGISLDPNLAILPPDADAFYVVDACLAHGCSSLRGKEGKWGAPNACNPKPCTKLPSNQAQSSYLSGEPKLAAAYLGWLIGPTLKSQTSAAKDAGGGNIWMFSGETNFFGALDSAQQCLWTPDKLQTFYDQLITNLEYACTSGNNATNDTPTNCDFKDYQFGIWNFSALINCIQNKNKASVR
jgi:hypothetical protein